jgi:Zn-dependent membrane protease YugP
VQDAQNYTPMRLRGAIVPAVQTGAWVGPLMFIGGLAFNNESLAFVGLIAFSLGALFALVTLPVEFDASRRALVMLQQYNVLEPAELPAAQRVLRAAALTYVAAALQSLGTVLYYATMLVGRRSDD